MARFPEQRLWDQLQRAMQGLWLYDRIEVKGTRGIPDVSFAVTGHHGWIELKVIPAWPKDPKHPVAIRHLTPQQRNWLTRRQRRAGNCWVLLKVLATDEYLIFSGHKVMALGHLSREEMHFNATAHWHGLIGTEILRVLEAG